MKESVAKSVLVFTVATAIILLLVNFGVRVLPFRYDTPGRDRVAWDIAIAGVAMLAWSPLGLIVLVRWWRALAVWYRMVFMLDLAFSATLLYYALRP